MSIKDRLYDYVVRKNENVRYEYERYVMENTIEHYENRGKHWKILWKLNWHYRVKKKNEPMMYFDKKEKSIINEKKNEEKNIVGAIKENTVCKKNQKREVKEKRTLSNSNNINKKGNFFNQAESSLGNRPEPYHFVKYLLQFDVISFDIFDTLLLRSFDSPETVFDIVGMRLKHYSIYESFTTSRKKAEKDCRNLKEIQTGSREITIHEIYDELERSIGIDSQKGMITELEVEKEYLHPNPYFQIVIKILISQGKRIVLTSDMYIPETYMKQILEKCGITEYEKLYVSCDYGCNKRSGELFRRVIDDYPNQTICHVGDNYQADILGAQKAKLDAKHYKNCNEIGKEFRAEWMSPVIGSAYRGLINYYLHNGTRKYDIMYEYGFVYGGIYIYGFCNWIKKKCEEDKIEKIIFLARDGDIYQKVFNEYFGGVENEYVFWSRFTSMKYLIEQQRNALIERIIKHKANSNLDYLLGDVLDSLGLKINEKLLRRYGLYKSSVISEDNLESIKKYIIEDWENVKNTYIDERELVEKELRILLGDKKRIGVVDVGWTGSGPIGFKTFVEKYVDSKYDVHCYMAGATSYYADGKYTTPIFLNNQMDSYLFNAMKNRRNEQIHYTTNLKITNNAVFEQFTQALYPSYKGLGENGKEIFDFPEVENYELTAKIQKGILDFCKLYHDMFKKDKYLYEISGWDAYRPFTYLAHHSKYFENHFGDMLFAYGIGGNESMKRAEKIKERAKGK